MLSPLIWPGTAETCHEVLSIHGNSSKTVGKASMVATSGSLRECRVRQNVTGQRVATLENLNIVLNCFTGLFSVLYSLFLRSHNYYYSKICKKKKKNKIKRTPFYEYACPNDRYCIFHLPCSEWLR